MRLRPMTIVDIMAIPIAVAGEIAIIQAMNDWSYQDWWFTIVQVPFATVLFFVILKIGLEIWRKGECSPFLFGFAASGPVAIFLVCLVLFEFRSVDAFSSFCLDWIPDRIRIPPHLRRSREFYHLLKTASCLILILPQGLFCMIGGGVARRLGLTVVRRPRSTCSPATPKVV